MQLQRRRLALAAVLILLLEAAAPVLAASEPTGYVWVRSVVLHVPAVTRTPEGFRGVMTEMVVTVAAPGTGTVYVSADPLTELDMQAAARMAALVATILTGYDYYSFDYFIHVKSNTTIVGGPSASGAMAVAIMAALRGKQIRSDFSMTGMVDPDATLGPVGGVPEKLLAAAQSGVRIFVIPAGQEMALDPNTGQKVNVVSLGMKYGVKVIAAKTILDAYAAATGDYDLLWKTPRLTKPEYPAWLSNALRQYALWFKKVAEGNLTCIRSLVEKMPETLADTFADAVKSAETSIAEGDRYMSEGRYYSAASRYFSAAITATHACLLARIIEAPNLLDALANMTAPFINAANRTANTVWSEARRFLAARNLTDVELQLGIATLTRARDANTSIRAAIAGLQRLLRGVAPVNLDSLSSVTGSVVYAYYRAVTAEQWLNTMKAASGGIEVSLPRLREAAYAMTYFADSTVSYALALGVPAENAEALVARAKGLLEKANTTLDYVMALVDAVRGYSDAATVFRASFLTGNESIEAAKEGLSILAGLAKSKGYTPILPLLYLEYGDALSGAQKLALYIQGASYAMLLNMLSGGAKPRLPSTKPRTLTVTLTKTVTITVPGKPGEEPRTVTVGVTATTTTTCPRITVTETRVSTTTVTRTVVAGVTASWASIAVVALIALAAGLAAARMSRG